MTTSYYGRFERMWPANIQELVDAAEKALRTQDTKNIREAAEKVDREIMALGTCGERVEPGD